MCGYYENIALYIQYFKFKSAGISRTHYNELSIKLKISAVQNFNSSVFEIHFIMHRKI